MTGIRSQALVRETPFVGEMLYSVRAREHAQLGLPSGAHLHAYQSAGQRRVFLGAPIPRDLSVFADYRPRHPLGDPGRALEQFTTLPYFTRFRRDRLDLLYAIGAAGLAGKPTAVWTRLSLGRYPIAAFPDAAGFCADCLLADRQGHDVWIAYWHREHQLPGVEHCLHHRRPLLAHCTRCGFSLQPDTRSLLMAGDCLCHPEEGLWVPRTDDTPLCTSEWLHFSRLSAECLEEPDTIVPEQLGRRLRLLLARRGFGHPSLLDLSKVAGAVLDRFDGAMLRRLFQGRDVEGLLVRRLRRMAGPDADRQPTILWILLIGTLFESIREFQEVVSSQAPDAKPHRAPGQRQMTKMETHRNAIREYLAANAGASREAVRLKLPGAHSYLQRWDRRWLQQSLPARRRPKPKARGAVLNYSMLDRSYAVKLDAAFDSLFAAEGRPVLASASAAAAEAGIGKGRLWDQRKQLPRSWTVIERRRESREAHQRRCLSWGLGQIKHHSQGLSTIALRHAARLPEHIILKHGPFVLAEAERLELPWLMPGWCRLASSRLVDADEASVERPDGPGQARRRRRRRR